MVGGCVAGRGACMVGEVYVARGVGGSVAGETSTAADGTRSTGKHSCCE